MTNIEKELLIELFCDTLLLLLFQNLSVVQLELNLNSENDNLQGKALKALLPFATSYLCETEFSVLDAVKSKHRARSFVEKELKVAKLFDCS